MNWLTNLGSADGKRWADQHPRANAAAVDQASLVGCHEQLGARRIAISDMATYRQAFNGEALARLLLTPPDANREWELDGATHRTEEDAFALVARAKTGAHVAATDTYLVKLRAEIYTWIALVDAELAARDHERARRATDGGS